MMRILGGLIALVGIFMGIIGLGGSSVLCFVSLVPIILGGLLFAAAQRRDKAEAEERRHQELMTAVRRGEK